MTSNSRNALVIGATGGVGSEAALALRRNGWLVRALHRQASAMSHRFTTLSEVQWVQGDAMNSEEVIAAARGVDIIVHAANPPSYKNWPTRVLPMIDASIAAAHASGARIILPGTIYNYPPDGPSLINEDTPQRATTRKGAIRIALEQRLQDATRDGVRTLILRAGDFFGPHTGNSWFSQGLVKPGRTVTSITYPGSGHVGHAWAYLPDVGETMAQLANREADLAAFETFNFGGHWLDPGIGMAEAIRRVIANPAAPIRSFPWWAIGLASPFVPLFRELWEMRYLWRVAIALDNTKLVSFLGQEPHTPLDEAVRASLEGLGCLPPRRAGAPYANVHLA